MSGMPAIAGTEMALVMPGTTSTSTPASRQKRELLAAAAEDERVAALEPHDALAVAGEGDEQRVDRVLRHGVVAGQLADVDDLGRQHDALGGEPVEHAARAEPVGDDDVGGLERAQAAEGEQAGVAGSGADERDLAGRGGGGHRAPPTAAGRGGAASVARAGRRRRAR